MFCFLMMMAFFVNVTVFQFFFIGFAQRYDLHIEMQLRARQWMVEIEPHVISLNAIDARITGMAFIIAHG